MNVENMKNFITALKSGQFQDRQTTETLSDGQNVCALGIVGEQLGGMMDYEKIWGHLGFTTTSSTGIFIGRDGNSVWGNSIDVKPEYVILNGCPCCTEWASGHPVEPIRIVPHLNDDHGWTFEQIGNWLAETYKDYLYPETQEAPIEVPEEVI